MPNKLSIVNVNDSRAIESDFKKQMLSDPFYQGKVVVNHADERVYAYWFCPYGERLCYLTKGQVEQLKENGIETYDRPTDKELSTLVRLLNKTKDHNDLLQRVEEQTNLVIDEDEAEDENEDVGEDFNLHHKEDIDIKPGDLDVRNIGDLDPLNTMPCINASENLIGWFSVAQNYRGMTGYRIIISEYGQKFLLEIENEVDFVEVRLYGKDGMINRMQRGASVPIRLDHITDELNLDYPITHSLVMHLKNVVDHAQRNEKMQPYLTKKLNITKGDVCGLTRKQTAMFVTL